MLRQTRETEKEGNYEMSFLQPIRESPGLDPGILDTHRVWALVAQLHLHNVNKPNKSDIKMRKIGNFKLPIPFLFFLTSIQSLSKPKKRQAHN